MIKVLIVTLWGDCNLGNKLQNYALNKLLYKHNVITTNMLIEGRKSLKSRMKTVIKIILSFLGNRRFLNVKYEKARSRVLKKFSDGYLTDRIVITSYSDVKYINFEGFDFGISGSDQVWHNWTGSKEELEYYYLMFLPPNKRTSFAASFGFDEFPIKDYAIHRKGLKEMLMVSCRENSGVELVKTIVGREAKLIPDPTLCISRKEWDQIVNKPQIQIDSPFLLVYFLGGINQEYQDTIDLIAKRNGLSIINIFEPRFKKWYLTSPNEFIWYVKNASFICTDSFHATVFSIIYEKKFFSFRRKEMNMDRMFDRIETLLHNTGLQERIYNGENKIEAEINFDNSQKYICQCHTVADKYIDELCRLVKNSML